MTDRTLLDRAGVARRLNVTVEWMYQHLASLEDFPKPVFGVMRGSRWDPAAIDSWLDRRMAPADRLRLATARDEPDWGALLDARAEAL